MMKFTHTINALVASVLVVPAITLQSHRGDSLNEALMKTVRALEQLAGLQADGAHDIRTILDATEAPIADGQERDDHLVMLRNAVSHLQSDLDFLEASTVEGAEGGDPTRLSARPGPRLGLDVSGRPSSVPTTGLSSRDRTSLGGIRPPVPISTATASHRESPSSMHREGPDYSADKVREGRTLYRAGRYAECITKLAEAQHEVAGIYWTSRCLEKLGRSEEALVGYRKIVEIDAESYEAERARDEIEFLEWKLAFTRQFAGRDGGESE